MRRNVIAEINRNPLKPVSQRYENVIQQSSTPFIQTFYEIKSSLYRHGNLQLPRLPRGIRGFSITGPWAKTLEHERFLLKIDRNWGIIIFCSGWQLDPLAEGSKLLSDGTFKSAPKLFYRLYTFFGVVGEQKLPVVYALLKNKTTGIHGRMLQFLKQKLRQRNKELAAHTNCLRLRTWLQKYY